MPPPITVNCDSCGRGQFAWQPSRSRWECRHCGVARNGQPGYLDLTGSSQPHTSDHYTLQWGTELGFLQFIQDQPGAKAVMPSAKLGWDQLFKEIRERAAVEPTSVYDAACGFGGITLELVTETTRPRLAYVGADVHGALPAILERVHGIADCGVLLRWDIGEPLPVDERFDYVICRAAVHHTPNPRQTFDALCSRLKPGGTIAISAYRRKGPCREASDDALRALVSELPPQEAFDACAEFTELGKALQRVTTPVEIHADLPLLGIRRGSYSVQSLVYYHLLKCFHNPLFGDRYSTLVNYDWYHPQYAYRFAIEELREWFRDGGIRIDEEQSIEVQHYLRGTRVA